MIYKDRDGNSKIANEKQDKALSNMYSNVFFRKILSVISNPIVSKVVGKFMDSWMSTFMIDSFVKKNHIKMSEYEKKRYRSYNEFFTRKIKASCRPIAMEPETLIAPCDGKVSAYPISMDATFQIKDSLYTVESMLRDAELAKKYNGGTCVIIRLTVDNYHRYCYIDDAIKERNHYIPGRLYTVNPIILKHKNIYKENSRAYCVLKTKNFKDVIQMEVGALMVGKINNYHRHAIVQRGQEKGRFEFGGSTVVLLLPPNAVCMDEDIIRNTIQGYETIVKMGERIGKAIVK